VTSEHALFFLYGTGANGKSVFVNTLATILGDYAANAPMDTFMETRTDRHPTDLAGLRGARFVAAIETEQGGAGRVQGQGHHRWRQDLGALHAPGLLRVRRSSSC
jgi:phage/plasmid-associated DNA primase